MRISLTMLSVVLLAAPVVALGQRDPQARPLRHDVQPGTRYYPTELVETGAHGTTLLKMKVDEEGFLIDPTLEESSKSKSLDEHAISFVSESKLKLNNPTTQKGSVLMAITFERDTVLTLPTKSCKEFNVDLAYARSVTRGATAGDTRSYKLATGMLMFMPGIPQEKQVLIAKNLKVLPALVEKACAEAPDEKFLDALTSVTPAA